MAIAKGQSLADIMGLTGHVPEVKKKKTQVIDSFSLDNEIYQEIYKDSKDIQDIVTEGDEIIRTFQDFAQDMYMGLYKHKPQLIEEADVKKTHKFNHKLMTEVMDLPEFRQLRKQTRLDIGAATLGMTQLAEQAVEIIRQYEEEAKNSQGGDGSGGMRSPFQDINDQMDAQGSGGEGGGDQQDPNAPDDPNGDGDSGAEPEIDPKAFENAMNKMREAVQETTDDVSETRDFLKAWGMDGGNPNNRVTFEDKRIALERLRKSERVKRLTEIVGRMKKLAINEKPQIAPDGAESIKSVVTGSNIEAILPSERVMLASSNPNVKRQFYRKFYENELLEYEKDVYESMGRGPMIVCCDVSGSMSGARDNWSKAVALALLEVAQRQKRNYACMHYNTRITEFWEIPKGELRPNDIFDIAEKFANGGTDFEAPLRKALEVVEKDGFKKGDVVFITDGDCSVSNEFLEEFNRKRKELDFQVMTVLIDMHGGGSRHTVKKFSDKIVEVSDLAKLEKQEKGALDIFQSVQ